VLPASLAIGRLLSRMMGGGSVDISHATFPSAKSVLDIVSVDLGIRFSLFQRQVRHVDIVAVGLKVDISSAAYAGRV